MSLHEFFIQIARDKLEPKVFADIMARAVAAERRRVEAVPTLPAALQVDKPKVAAKVEAHLNGLPPPQTKPHVAERIEERMEITVGPSDLGELAGMVRRGGPDVVVTKQYLETIIHARVHWRGKNFMVIFSKTRDSLITAHAIGKQWKPIKARIKEPRPVHKPNRINPRLLDLEEDEDGHGAGAAG